MVLPVRIELTTSALPRMRSTTELRQHFVRERRAYEGGPRARQPVAARARQRHVDDMAEKDKEREERLAAALRENLRRRKAQARELGGRRKEGELEVAIAHRLVAERALDALRQAVADPDDDSEQKNGENELQSGDHESPPDFRLSPKD